MLSPWLLPVSFGVTLLLLCAMGFLVRTGVRTRNLGRCWRCGAAKVRPSKSRSMDKLAGCLVLRPYRCGGCLTRFYAFRTFTPALAIAQIKAPSRIRVKVIVRLPWPTDWEQRLGAADGRGTGIETPSQLELISECDIYHVPAAGSGTRPQIRAVERPRAKIPEAPFKCCGHIGRELAEVARPDKAIF